MNMKITSVLVMTVMVLASAGAIALAGHSDAASDTLIKESEMLVDSDGTERSYMINQLEYEGWEYAIIWSAATVTSLESIPGSDTTWKELYNGSPKIDVSVGNFTLNMSAGTYTGSYNLKVTSSAAENTPENICLRCQVQITIDETPRIVDSLYYTFELTKVADTLTITNDLSGLVVGTPYSESVSVGALTIADYKWYAIGLPDGMSMSESGKITGIPTGSETGSPITGTATIVATHISTGMVLTGTINFTVSEAETLEYGVYINDVALTAPYIVIQGDDVTLKTTLDGSAIDVASVTVISEEGKESTVTKTEIGNYTIPTNGTGAYRIVIAYNNYGMETTEDFYLYITSPIANVTAGITISGN